MLISKIQLPRRTVLKAVGATVGLPLLEAMIPAATAHAAPRPCLSFIYFPHGAVMDQWTPAGETAGFELPPILAPLAAVGSPVTVISGLENPSALATPVHSRTASTWLTCAVPQPGAEAKGGVSVDQLASKLSHEMRFESLHLSTESSSDSQTLSTASSMEHDPRAVFARLFGSTRSGSVLDLIRGDAARLSRKVGARDRATLADYFANLRAVEMRVNAAPTLPFNERMRLMFDLLALAYQANLTRVGTFMMAAETSEQSYDFAGVSESFHSLSHHGNSAAKLARLVKVQTANTGLFAEFVAKLAATPDGDGSLLDHSLLVYGSNMSNSNLHDHTDLPIALVGGWLEGGRHVKCAAHTPLANLHVALLNKMGVPTRHFADSTGELALT
jgi:hypothetical protein